MAVSPIIRVEGLREIAHGLKETDREMLKELTSDLKDVGEVVRKEAATLFDRIDARSAAGFDSRVRVNTSTVALVSVGQKKRKTTGKRPDYGALQVTAALLPAREQKQAEATRVLENGAIRLLRENGIT